MEKLYSPIYSPVILTNNNKDKPAPIHIVIDEPTQNQKVPNHNLRNIRQVIGQVPKLEQKLKLTKLYFGNKQKNYILDHLSRIKKHTHSNVNVVKKNVQFPLYQIIYQDYKIN